MKQIEGQITIFDVIAEPVRKQNSCAACNVAFGSIACFKKRGYIWDPVNRFAKDSDGKQIRRPMEKRECKRTFY